MKPIAPAWPAVSARHRYQGPIVLPSATGRRGFTLPQTPTRRRRILPRQGFARPFDEQRRPSMAGGRQLWLAVARVLLAAAPLLLALQWHLCDTSASYERRLAECRATNQLLQENMAALDSLRSRLSSPERIRIMAEEKLSLHRPEKEQVKVF